jgi:hypothetical protein
MGVMARSQEHDATERLSNLRRAQPEDPTLKNLLAVLSAKLDLSARLPVCEWEAAQAGDAHSAAAFRRLAEEERESCALVVDCLHQHLEQRGDRSTHGGEAA